jgi:uncharacterized damage-inducible protein DinB
MHLKKASLTIIDQLTIITSQLSSDEFSASLDLLNGNSVGKHMRHIVEFFDLLISNAAVGLINYDRRQHDEMLENDVRRMKLKLDAIKNEISRLPFGKELMLEVSYDTGENENVQLKSSVDRELAYNIEHAIHHMAIIKIAIQTLFPNVDLPENFGIAYSTIRYQKSN